MDGNPLPPRARSIALAAIAASALSAGVAQAASAPSKTTATAKKQTAIYSPKKSPVKIGSAPRNKPLPRGDALVSREVTITRGKDKGKSTNVVTLTCPGTLTVSAIADSKDLGKPMPYTFNKQHTYGRGVGKIYPTAYDLKAGKKRTGTLYALCVPNA